MVWHMSDMLCYFMLCHSNASSVYRAALYLQTLEQPDLQLQGDGGIEMYVQISPNFFESNFLSVNFFWG
jgi:hypothetical protein